MNRLKILREEKGLNKTELANILGIKPQSIGQYERGERDLSTDKLILFAEFFGVTTDYILGISNTRVSPSADLNNLLHLPVVGKVPAGIPVLANENIINYLPISTEMFPAITNEEEAFILKVDGESMNNIIPNGSFVLVRKQDYAKNGDIVIAIVNDDNEATLKKYKTIDSQFVMLEPDSSNPIFEPIVINIKNQNFRIIGKVVGYYKEF